VFPGLLFIARPDRLRVISTAEKREKKKGKKEKTRTASLGVEGGRREGKEAGRMDRGIVLGSRCSLAHQGMGTW